MGVVLHIDLVRAALPRRDVAGHCQRAVDGDAGRRDVQERDTGRSLELDVRAAETGGRHLRLAELAGQEEAIRQIVHADFGLRLHSAGLPPCIDAARGEYQKPLVALGEWESELKSAAARKQNRAVDAQRHCDRRPIALLVAHLALDRGLHIRGIGVPSATRALVDAGQRGPDLGLPAPERGA